MPVLFQNDGEIDPRLLTTLGVNVKESSTAIGFFGTGLKYALATLLRNDQGVIVHSGTDKYEFQVNPTEIRGKLFGIIQISRNGEEYRDLGFTTELGKKWELWMAFRELYSNAADEGGYCLNDVPVPMPGTTVVEVEGASFDDIYQTRWSYFINPARAPIYEDKALQVFEGSSPCVFYKGIRVHSTRESTRFTYNVLAECSLTEDRTASEFDLFFSIHRAVKNCSDEKLLERFLWAGPGYFEHVQGWYGGQMPKEFCKIARRLWAKNPQRLNENFMSRVQSDSAAEESEWTDIVLEASERDTLSRALRIVRYVGFDIRDNQVRVVEEVNGETNPRLVGGPPKIMLGKHHLHKDDLSIALIWAAAALGAATNNREESWALSEKLFSMSERLSQYENQKSITS